MKNLLAMIVALAVLVANAPKAKAEVNCDSAAGVLALMGAKVVVGTPGDPSNIARAKELPFLIQSELFKVPQSAATNNTCAGKVRFRLYTSSSKSALDALPGLATADPDFALPSGVIASNITPERSGNVITLKAQRSRTDHPFVRRVATKGTPATIDIPPRLGNTVWYRVAKRIQRCSSCTSRDPYVFSPVFSFVVPAAPVEEDTPPPPPPDLVPTTPTGPSANRPLFKPSSGSNSAGGVTFLKIPAEFCQALGDPETGCQSAAGCSHSAVLGPIVFGAKNTGDGAAGAFSVTLQRRDRVGSNAVSALTQVASEQVTGLAGHGQSPNFSFAPNRTVTIFTLQNNPGSCFVRCDPNQSGCVVDYQEVEYSIHVDGGDNVADGGRVSESSESNNEAKATR